MHQASRLLAGIRNDGLNAAACEYAAASARRSGTDDQYLFRFERIGSLLVQRGFAASMGFCRQRMAL